MSIHKTNKTKNGKQQYRVFVNYKRPDGSYGQKTKCVYGKDEARIEELKMINDLNLSIDNTIRPATIGALFEEYMAAKKHEVRQTTYDKSIRIANRYYLPYLEKVKVKNLNKTVLQKWKNKMSETELSTRTLQNIYKELHAFLNYGVKMDYYANNPLDALGNFKSVLFEKPQDKIQYYTAEQFKKFIAVALEEAQKTNNYKYYVFFNIAFYTGMRKGEINALKWDDIEGDTINVKRSISQKIKGVPITETPPKNKSSYRSLKMPQNLIVILNEQMTRQKQINENLAQMRVCGGIDVISDTTLSNKNIKYANAAGLPPIRIHDFRHTHASLLVNAGINIKEIAKRLGHSKVEMTWNTYSHLYPKEEERVIRVLENI